MDKPLLEAVRNSHQVYQARLEEQAKAKLAEKNKIDEAKRKKEEEEKRLLEVKQMEEKKEHGMKRIKSLQKDLDKDRNSASKLLSEGNKRLTHALAS